MRKPLLLGMNNPLSDDPEYDLYPYPEGCSGWRLWKMLPEGTTRKQYLDAFERRDLLRSRTWDPKAARAAVPDLMPHLIGRYVIVLGTAVRIALDLPAAEPLTPMIAPRYIQAGSEAHDLYWVPFPHPSGRNRWFMDKQNYQRACEVLAGMCGMTVPA